MEGSKFVQCAFTRVQNGVSSYELKVSNFVLAISVIECLQSKKKTCAVTALKDCTSGERVVRSES